MEKPNRPQRNRRHSRRAWPPEDDSLSSRAAKRLFTPEIKRMLKEWLIRRRDNPYPSREEKKRLAIQSGLTYIQICNWFANWRRKLKNSERERAKKSWGHLIKNYNTNAKGNVEQFSISSEDSIWEEDVKFASNEMTANEDCSNDGDSNSSYQDRSAGSDETYYAQPYQTHPTNSIETRKTNYQIEDTNEQHYLYQHCLEDAIHHDVIISNDSSSTSNNKAKYKQKIMEKYLKDTTQQQLSSNDTLNATEGTLSKWLESAANFTPNKNNYYIEWNQRCRDERKYQPTNNHKYTAGSEQDSAESFCVSVKSEAHRPQVFEAIHHKDELDAAEALANLAFNCRQRKLDTTVSIYPNINTIIS